jgi:hypothetical protein
MAEAAGWVVGVVDLLRLASSIVDMVQLIRNPRQFPW